MTKPEAEKLFSLSGGYEATDVKKAYKTMSSKHHPDKGGDVEMMKSINKAWDLLKGNSKGGTTEYNREEFREKYVQKAKDVADDISNKFDIDAFKTYFKSHIGQDFISEVIIIDGSEVGKWGTPSLAGIRVRFHTADNKIAFDFDAIAYLFGEKSTKGLSNVETISYSIGVTAFGYANRKKQKMSARDWKRENDHVLLSDPKKSFPVAKMKKIASGASGVMKKADFILAIKKELKASTWNTDSFLVPLKDGYILISRSVFMRTPVWQTMQIGTLRGKYAMDTTATIYKSFPENEETLDQFLSWTKMTMSQTEKTIKKMKDVI